MCYVPYSELNFGIRIYPADQFPKDTLISLKCGCVEKINTVFDGESTTVSLYVTCSPDHTYQFNKWGERLALRWYYKATELPDYQFYKLPE